MHHKFADTQVVRLTMQKQDILQMKKNYWQFLEELENFLHFFYQNNLSLELITLKLQV